eukprot:CAMPEP_0175751572 /NCGR_PEP_ID=MMETSP0097-20121207/61293_1 /TAXON_ID=311494 /ORGANISM="Alexandrium monilatum, Strain CCMP3105" /LENGTH=69 /DNA_ID=CAMNT_0017060279 /DNA_START=101 /DNA_END=307 /DNA_ORIENTATION=+
MCAATVRERPVLEACLQADGAYGVPVTAEASERVPRQHPSTRDAASFGTSQHHTGLFTGFQPEIEPGPG